MKRLIILCDGTGQSTHRGDKPSFPSNVKNLGDCLEQTYDHNGKLIPQIIYYQSGVGTSKTTWINDKISEGVGLGIDDNILDAYYFLCSNYEEEDLPGGGKICDEICIFGFSRGAFIARVVANLVVTLGLLHMNVSWMIRRAWAQYKVDDSGDSFNYFVTQLHEEYSGSTRDANVKVLGVWDTVGAVLNLKVYDTKLHWGIENVFHALALDEYREAFGPTLFYLPEKEGVRPDGTNRYRRKEQPINLKQCWFAGSHTDIGGGYASSHQSNITLAWMIDNCRNFLAFNNNIDWEEEDKGRKWKKIINAHHRPQDHRIGSHIEEARVAGEIENVYPGWGLGIIRDSYGEFLNGIGGMEWQYRAPGNYAKRNEHPGQWGLRAVPLPTMDTFKNAPSTFWSYWKSEEPQTICKNSGCHHPVQLWNQIGATNETIHATVYTRYKKQQEARDKKQQKELDPKQQKEWTQEQHKAWKKQQVEEERNRERLKKWNPKSLDQFREKDSDRFHRVECAQPEGGGRYKNKWVGSCLLHKGKQFEVWEEPDDEVGKENDPRLMEQLRTHDDDFWNKSHVEGVNKDVPWLELKFEYSKRKEKSKPKGE